MEGPCKGGTQDVCTETDLVCLMRPAGKYLNAIRECGRAMPPPLASSHKIAYDPSHTYITSIHAAHARASAALLRVLVEEAGLMGWLRSIKHFFLLDQVGWLLGKSRFFLLFVDPLNEFADGWICAGRPCFKLRRVL